MAERYDEITAILLELVGNGDPEAVRDRLNEYDVREVQAAWVAVWPGHPKPVLPPSAPAPQIVKALAALDLVKLQ